MASWRGCRGETRMDGQDGQDFRVVVWARLIGDWDPSCLVGRATTRVRPYGW